MGDDREWLDTLDSLGLACSYGVDLPAAFRRLSGEPPADIQATFDEAWGHSFTGDPNNRIAVQLDRLGDWDLIIEPNGYLASAYGDRLTAEGGRLVSMYWNVNGYDGLSAAQDGAWVRQVALPGPHGVEVGEPLEQELGLAWTPADGPPWERHSRRSMLTLIERTCGAALDADRLLHGARRTLLVVEPPRA
jgi:hypothetical protein